MKVMFTKQQIKEIISSIYLQGAANYVCFQTAEPNMAELKHGQITFKMGYGKFSEKDTDIEFVVAAFLEKRNIPLDGDIYFRIPIEHYENGYHFGSKHFLTDSINQAIDEFNDYWDNKETETCNDAISYADKWSM